MGDAARPGPQPQQDPDLAIERFREVAGAVVLVIALAFLGGAARGEALARALREVRLHAQRAASADSHEVLVNSVQEAAALIESR